MPRISSSARIRSTSGAAWNATRGCHSRRTILGLVRGGVLGAIGAAVSRRLSTTKRKILRTNASAAADALASFGPEILW